MGGAFVIGTLLFTLLEGWARGFWQPDNFAYQASAWATFVAQFTIIVAVAALASVRLFASLARRLDHPFSRLHIALLVAAVLVVLGFPLAWHYLFVYPTSYVASAFLAAVAASQLACRPTPIRPPVVNRY